MKKTQWIELFYNIRHTAVSFVAITLFVALATGIFTGLRWTVKSVDNSVDLTYSKGNMHHFKLSYPLGFASDFTENLSQKGLCDEAEGSYEAYGTLCLENDRYKVKLVSLTEK